jgi:hypothetical protein
LWDLARGQPLHRFVGHDSAVASLAFSPDGGRLVSGLGDSTLLVWDVAAILRQRRPAAPLSAEAAARAWMDLAVEDGRRAFAALGALADDPARSVPLLAGRLRPVPSVEPDRVRQLLADLTSERFAVREKARRELEALEEQAAPAFRRSLAANPSLEMRRRVERLLDRLQLPVTRPELIQSLRAVAVLEHVGSPEARHILEGLAKGDPEARLTREARQAREKGKRLRQKPVP